MGNPALFLILLFEEGNVLAPDVTALIVFVVAILLTIVLNAILFKPVLSVLDEREQRTSGTLAEARTLVSESDEKLARYEEAIRAARAENYRVLEARRKQALDERAKAITQAKAEAQQKIMAARAEIAAGAEEAKQTLERESRLMAARIAGSVLRRGVPEA